MELKPVCGGENNILPAGVCGKCAMGLDGNGGDGAAAGSVASGESTCPETALACCADGRCIPDGNTCGSPHK